jgi:hypothetical protein
VLAGHDGAAQVDGIDAVEASSVISVGEASPPARLTPTLLCSTSMRLHNFMASATAAFRAASLVTLAAKGTHVPPSFVTMSAVSLADSSR